jgi:hypothetical protein
VSFEQLVIAKLDEIQRTQAAHGERLAALEERTKAPPRGGLLRDGTLTVSGGAVTALLSFLADRFSKGAH